MSNFENWKSKGLTITDELKKPGREHIKAYMDELAEDSDIQGNKFVDEYRREKLRKDRLNKFNKLNEST